MRLKTVYTQVPELLTIKLPHPTLPLQRGGNNISSFHPLIRGITFLVSPFLQENNISSFPPFQGGIKGGKFYLQLIEHYYQQYILKLEHYLEVVVIFLDLPKLDEQMLLHLHELKVDLD